MKTKLVKRHWCDFCGKAGLQAHAMAKHEAHCTLNPARDCRVCGLLGGSVKVGAERMAMLIAMLPDPTEYLASNGWAESADSQHARLSSALSKALPKLRAEVENCPACILAVLRQKKIPVPMVDEFNFTAEMKSIFNDINSDRAENYGYY